jgi:tetratricopeptide (TPR) repeat protein
MYLSMGKYEQAVSSAKESSDSKAIGAGALAAHALAAQSQNPAEQERLYLDAVEMAAACEEESPRAQASFDAWVLGTLYVKRGETEKAVALFNEAVALGYGTTLPQGTDGLEFASYLLGWEAFKDEDARDPDHELIQGKITDWQKAKKGASLREFLEYLEEPK